MILFLLLYVAHWPVIDIFYDYGFFREKGSYIIQRSLGNMGYSQTKCQSHSLQYKLMEDITCQNGQISTLVDWGFQTIYENQLKCHRTEENSCMKFLDQEAFVNFYAEKCFGEVSCTIEDLTRFIMNGTRVTYFFGYSEIQESASYTQEIAQCNDISTRFFI